VRVRQLFLAALLLATVAVTEAQQPTFKSGVDLVRFDVRVVDGNGRPVTDLRPEEIEIVEGGQPLPVVLFQRVTEPAGSYVDEAMRAVSSEVSSNEAFPRGHLYILLFDQQHITPGNEQRARQAAEAFVRTRVRPTDRVALYALPGPGPQIGFTSDRVRVINELGGIRGSYQRVITMPQITMNVYEAHRIVQGDEQLLTSAMERMARSGLSDVSGRAGSGGATAGGGGASPEDPSVSRRLIKENAQTIVNQSDAESRALLQRVADMLTGLRDIEGRKTVVLFTEGFFQDNLGREIEAVAAAAAQSYCVFYPFDLNARTQPLSEGTPSETTIGSEIQARLGPMGTLAEETDGAIVIDASGRTDAALATLADQARDYYLIGFQPSDAARAERGKYRRVTVRVKRAGARASARTGYALPRETALPDKRRAIDTVLGAPFVQQGLKIDYTTYVLKGPEAGKQRVVLSLVTELPVRGKPGDTADVVFVARDVKDGRVVASGSDTISLPASARSGSAMGASAWRVQFIVPPGSYLMRTVVREPGGLAGSADRRIDVRPLDGPEIAVSDLVIGSTLAALPVQPRASIGEGLSGVLEAYGRSAVQMEGLDVRIELRQPGSTAVRSVQAELLEPQDDAAGLSRRVRFTMSLEGVAPGAYTAHAIVRSRGETVAERTRQVQVVDAPSGIPVEGDPTVPFERVTPMDVVTGDLGRKYIVWLQSRAKDMAESEAGKLAAQGRWELAEARLQRAGDDRTVVTRALRGLALFVREDFTGAARLLTEALAAEPQSSLTAFFLGWAHEGAGETRDAIGAWRNAVHLDPTLISAHIALADAYVRLSQPALALQAIRAGLVAVPNSPELRERLARLESRTPR
jgi:VWFA-related protein